MATLLLELPGDLLDAARLTETELRAELAIHLYEQHKLSQGKAAEVAGLDTARFLMLLGARGVPVNYGVEAYEEDLETLQRLDRS